MVIAVKLSGKPSSDSKKILEQLRWASMTYWGLTGVDSETKGLVSVLDLVAIVLEHRNFKAAATAFVSELTQKAGCDRVSLGILQNGQSRLQALSHSARFSGKANLARALEAVMDEALDQRRPIVLSQNNKTDGLIVRAHRKLIERKESQWVCTLPLVAEGVYEGALVLECATAEGLSSNVKQWIQQASVLVFPVLLLKQREERSLARKVYAAGRDRFLRFFGPGYLLLKLVTLLTLALLSGGFLIDGDYQVSARAQIEAKSLRVIVAPQSGYIKQADMRAGDAIKPGDLLAALDDRDLKLERIKWFGQREQLRKEHRGALAEHDRTQVNILNAQIAQAEAQLALVDEKLSRITILSPIEGLVVSGDLSQSLGAPVERGDVLFQVAPNNSYRVILHVDERDISAIATGQQGRVSLNSLPDAVFDIEIEKITPVSTAAEGINSFRIEALLQQKFGALRPGMTGIGKVEVGSRALIWIWTHRFGEWLRLQLWSWWG